MGWFLSWLRGFIYLKFRYGPPMCSANWRCFWGRTATTVHETFPYLYTKRRSLIENHRDFNNKFPIARPSIRKSIRGLDREGGWISNINFWTIRIIIKKNDFVQFISVLKYMLLLLVLCDTNFPSVDDSWKRAIF